MKFAFFALVFLVFTIISFYKDCVSAFSERFSSVSSFAVNSMHLTELSIIYFFDRYFFAKFLLFGLIFVMFSFLCFLWSKSFSPSPSPTSTFKTKCFAMYRESNQNLGEKGECLFLCAEESIVRQAIEITANK